jgi:hypothetical protein
MGTTAQGINKPDWDALARALKVDTASEAQDRAFEIAKFVARVEDDKSQTLVLKTGGKYIELSLNE